MVALTGLDMAGGQVALSPETDGTPVCDYVQWDDMAMGTGDLAAAAVTATQWSAATDAESTMTAGAEDAICWSMGPDNNSPARWTLCTF